MAYIWRVEDEMGDGIHTHSDMEEITGARLMPMNSHPSPDFDKVLGYFEKDNPDDWYFGFATLAQMRQWIRKKAWRVALKERGFVLNRYEMDNEDFSRSNFQAIFLKENARLVETRALDYAD